MLIPSKHTPHKNHFYFSSKTNTKTLIQASITCFFSKFEKQMSIIENFERPFGASAIKIMFLNEELIVWRAQTLASWRKGVRLSLRKKGYRLYYQPIRERCTLHTFRLGVSRCVSRPWALPGSWSCSCK